MKTNRATALVAGVVLAGVGGVAAMSVEAGAVVASTPAPAAAAGASAGGTTNPPAPAPPTPLQIIQGSVAKTETGTSRIDGVVEVVGSPNVPDGTLRYSVDGSYDFKAQTGEFTIDDRALPFAFVDRTIIDGSTVYLQPTSAATTGVWLKVDVPRLAQYETQHASYESQAPEYDPAYALELLAGASGNVTSLGRDQVMGTPATHYSVPISMDKARTSAADPVVATDLEHEIEHLGTNQSTADVWVSDTGRLVKVSYSFALSSQDNVFVVDPLKPANSASQTLNSGTERATVTISDYGAPVYAKVPCSCQVVDFVGALAGP